MTVPPAEIERLRAEAHARAEALPQIDYPRGKPELRRCRSCLAPIWWRLNPSGKWQPMDYDLVTAQPSDTPHHATCRDRERWRKR